MEIPRPPHVPYAVDQYRLSRAAERDHNALEHARPRRRRAWPLLVAILIRERTTRRTRDRPVPAR